MNFILYRNIASDKAIDAFCNGTKAEQFEALGQILQVSQRFSLRGDIFKNYLAYLVVTSENPFSLACERNKAEANSSLYKAFQKDTEEIIALAAKLSALSKSLGVSDIAENFSPQENAPFNFERCACLADFASSFASAKTPAELQEVITKFYLSNGCGKFALASAFRYNVTARTLEPALPLQTVQLSDLVGYESQKERVVKNTEDFLAARPSNNVLLYGAGGTGKSTTIKALLNKYSALGLRVIEVYKQHFPYLDDILDEVKERNYRFILFLDDLSFENFETEYKYLKAFIEGGITAKPENVLIYATSNRRHLMKETWNDRTDKEEDMHISETMQEKLSLVDRFGLAIRYASPEQEEYLEIARQTALKLGAKKEDVETVEFEKEAVQWELRHGGFSGRCASQFAASFVNRRK